MSSNVNLNHFNNACIIKVSLNGDKEIDTATYIMKNLKDLQ